MNVNPIEELKEHLFTEGSFHLRVKMNSPNFAGVTFVGHLFNLVKANTVNYLLQSKKFALKDYRKGLILLEDIADHLKEVLLPSLKKELDDKDIIKADDGGFSVEFLWIELGYLLEEINLLLINNGVAIGGVSLSIALTFELTWKHNDGKKPDFKSCLEYLKEKRFMDKKVTVEQFKAAFFKTENEPERINWIESKNSLKRFVELLVKSYTISNENTLLISSNVFVINGKKIDYTKYKGIRECGKKPSNYCNVAVNLLYGYERIDDFLII